MPSPSQATNPARDPEVAAFLGNVRLLMERDRTLSLGVTVDIVQNKMIDGVKAIARRAEAVAKDVDRTAVLAAIDKAVGAAEDSAS